MEVIVIFNCERMNCFYRKLLNNLDKLTEHGSNDMAMSDTAANLQEIGIMSMAGNSLVKWHGKIL
jgi:hypothetical protein